MRIVSLKEFMTLPAGTVYEQITDRSSSALSSDTGALMIKGSAGSISERKQCDWNECPLAGTHNLLSENLPGGMDGYLYLRDRKSVV